MGVWRSGTTLKALNGGVAVGLGPKTGLAGPPQMKSPELVVKLKQVPPVRTVVVKSPTTRLLKLPSATWLKAPAREPFAQVTRGAASAPKFSTSYVSE